MPIFSKKRPFSQKHCALMSIKKNINPLLSCPYLIKKRQLSKKKNCSHNIFFKFFMKNPQSCQTHIWSKKLSMLPKIRYIMGHKSQEDSIFSDLSRKITSLMPIFCKKKRQFSKKHPDLMPIFCRKNVQNLKNTILSCHFLQICH